MSVDTEGSTSDADKPEPNACSGIGFSRKRVAEKVQASSAGFAARRSNDDDDSWRVKAYQSTGSSVSDSRAHPASDSARRALKRSDIGWGGSQTPPPPSSPPPGHARSPPVRRHRSPSVVDIVRKASRRSNPREIPGWAQIPPSTSSKTDSKKTRKEKKSQGGGSSKPKNQQKRKSSRKFYDFRFVKRSKVGRTPGEEFEEELRRMFSCGELASLCLKPGKGRPFPFAHLLARVPALLGAILMPITLKVWMCQIAAWGMVVVHSAGTALQEIIFDLATQITSTISLAGFLVHLTFTVMFGMAVTRVLGEDIVLQILRFIWEIFFLRAPTELATPRETELEDQARPLSSDDENCSRDSEVVYALPRACTGSSVVRAGQAVQNENAASIFGFTVSLNCCRLKKKNTTFEFMKTVRGTARRRAVKRSWPP